MANDQTCNKSLFSKGSAAVEATLVSGMYGQALYFDGVNQWINLGRKQYSLVLKHWTMGAVSVILSRNLNFWFTRLLTLNHSMIINSLTTRVP